MQHHLASSTRWPRHQLHAVLIAIASIELVGGLDAPYSGVPFLRQQPLGRLPDPHMDDLDDDAVVTRLLPNIMQQKSAHACDDGEHAAKGRCLSVPGRACMWTSLQGKWASDTVSYCLPCELDGKEIPCWNSGAWVGGKQVTECVMACPHQKRIWQPDYACANQLGGFISNAQCFDRGKRSGSSCMFVAYDDANGESKASCGPCQLAGTGSWGCPALGEKGPDDGSKVTFCSSQCEELVCPGSPGCAVAPVQTAFDLQTVRKLGPGVGKASAPASEMISAPEGLPLNAAPPQIPTVNPLWTTTLPKRYVPVIMYRRPEDVAATSVAPPTWNPEWFAWPTLSPVAADMGASVSGQTGQMSLVSTRLRGKPHDPIAPDQP